MAEIFDFGLQKYKLQLSGAFNRDSMFAVVGDTARRLEVQLLDSRGVVTDTTGLSLRLSTVVGEQATYTDAVAVDATKGEYRIDLTNGMLLKPGTQEFQWTITDAEGERIHSFPFKAFVGKNLSEGGQQSYNFYLSYDELKDGIKQVEGMQKDLVDGAVDSAAIQEHVADRYAALEEEYAPKLNEVTAQLAQKASIAYINDSVGDLASATPTGYFSDLTALESAHPDGADTPKLVGINGVAYTHIYNGSSWQNVGVYQQNLLQDRSVNHKHIDPESQHTQLSFSSPFHLESGSISSSTGEDSPGENSSRIRSSLMKVNAGDVLVCDSEDIAIGLYRFNLNLEVLGVQGLTKGRHVMDDGYIRIVLQDITNSEADISHRVSEMYEMISIERMRWKEKLHSFINENNYNPKNFVVSGKNLFNKYDLITGYVGGDNDMFPVESYRTNRQLIPVEEGKPYAITHPRKILMLDGEKEPFDFVDVGDRSNQIYTPQIDGYLIISVETSAIDETQVEQNDVHTEVESYYEVLEYGKDNAFVNKLYGKSLLNLGDSIANGAPYEDNYISYAHLIANRNNMTINSKATGGASMANTDDNNNIHNQIDSAIQEGIPADYILINGMTNDIATSRNVPLGSISTGYGNELDLTTFCGALESAFKKIRLNWLTGKIIYIRQHHMISRDINKQKEYGDKAIEVCNKWSIPFVDLYSEGGLNTMLPEMKEEFTTDSDGTHPTIEAYELFYVPPIETKMRSV